MGTCCSTPEQQQQGAERRKKKSNNKNNNKPPPIRFGAEGLLDLGLEYRFLPCSKHTADTTRDNDDDSKKEQSKQSQSMLQQCSTSTSTSLSCMECSHRLFRIEDNVMITTTNRKQYIPGRIYDQMARAAQEEVVKWLQRDYQMQFLPTFEIITKDENKSNTNKKEESEDASSSQIVNTLVTTPTPSTTATTDTTNKTTTTTTTLVIINGRGVARAGILSTRHTVESGIEKGSAVYHIAQALKRNWDVVCLDSNAQGPTMGLDTVCKSLASPVLQQPYLSKHRKICFLCHSAAGGNLVQYLLRDDCSLQLEQIQALVFTDSTHDLQWLSLQKNPTMMEFLQSSKCLYIRNNREHVSDTFGPNHRLQPAGYPYNNSSDTHWTKRFGNIKTVYAGTTDHSLMCYQARTVIWDFFDDSSSSSSSFQNQQQQIQQEDEGHPLPTTNGSQNN